MMCQVDYGPLIREAVGAGFVLRCTQCRGVFVPERLYHQEPSSTTYFEHLMQQIHQPWPDYWDNGNPLCPQHGTWMNTVEHKGFVLNVCFGTRCVWVDANTFDRLQTLVATDPPRPTGLQNPRSPIERFDTASIDALLDFIDEATADLDRPMVLSEMTPNHAFERTLGATSSSAVARKT